MSRIRDAMRNTKVLGKRQFGDGELVLDRASLLLVDLGVDQVANKARSGAASGIRVTDARALLCAARQSLSRW
jgi:hypothetical protein